MSSVETGQMSAVETGQMSAAETGHLSCLNRRHLFQGGPPGGSSLQHVDQIAILRTHPGTRPARTGAVRGYGVKHPQTDPPHPRAKARMTAVKQTPSNKFAVLVEPTGTHTDQGDSSSSYTVQV